jgi:hypothetical protein
VETATGHKLVRKVEDPSFNPESINNYRLLIQFGISDLQFFIINPKNMILVLEDYEFSDVDTEEELLLILHELYKTHELLSKDNWAEVLISIKNNKFVQVPELLFHKKAGIEYLKFNSKIDPVSEVTQYTRSAGSDAITVFGLSAALLNWLKSVYKHSACRFTHQSAALIAATTQSNATQNALFVFADRFRLHILYTDSGKLQFYNQFNIKEFSDFIRYILLVMSTLQLSQDKTQLILWGFTGKSSPHFQVAEKYIRKVKLGERLGNLRFGIVFDSISAHQFIDLFAIPLTAA